MWHKVLWIKAGLNYKEIQPWSLKLVIGGHEF